MPVVLFVLGLLGAAALPAVAPPPSSPTKIGYPLSELPLLCDSLRIEADTANTFCLDSVVLLSAVSSGEVFTYNWTVDGMVIGADSLLEWEPQDTGVYEIRLAVTGADNCTAEATRRITIRDCTVGCEVVFPEAFTPNDDNVNDRFRAFFAETCRPPEFEMRVFNRWGQQVFTSTNPETAWDGRLEGEPQPAGLYIYYCDFAFRRGEPKQHTRGAVTLVR